MNTNNISIANKIANPIKIMIFMGFSCLFVACNTQNEATETVAAAASTTAENIVVLTDAQFKNAKIASTILQDKSVAIVLKLNGKIDVPPQNLVSVSAPLGGYLRSTKLLPGMHVTKGDIIAVMEDQQRATFAGLPRLCVAADRLQPEP